MVFNVSVHYFDRRKCKLMLVKLDFVHSVFGSLVTD